MIKNNKGVTLVELLIVIVILGIIAAISIPAVGNIVTNAQRDALITEASNIRSAANTFCLSEGASECDLGGDFSLSKTQLSNYYPQDNDDIDFIIGQVAGDWFISLHNSSNGTSYTGRISSMERNEVSTTAGESYTLTTDSWN